MPIANQNLFNQSRSFYLVSILELWQRFSYYGLQCILPLYFVWQLELTLADAFRLFSTYVALAFGFISVGRWLGEQILGIKRTLLLGSLLMMAGYVLLVLSTHKNGLIYFGLATISVGNGLFKTNPVALLSDIYNRTRFTLYHTLACLGSITAIILTPWVAHHYDWNIAFSLGVFGMFLVIIHLIFGKHYLNQYGTLTDQQPVSLKVGLLVSAIITAAIVFSSFLLHHQTAAPWILVVLFIANILFYWQKLINLKSAMRRKMMIVFILLLMVFVFFTLYLQIPTSLNFFAIHHVSHQVMGISFLPEQFQALNPIWIVITAPMLAALYNRLGNYLPIPHKLAIGMVLCSSSFLVLPWGATFSDSSGFISAHWLILSYALHSIGHPSISALGLIIVNRMVPAELKNFTTSMCFFTFAAAALTAGKVATQTIAPLYANSPYISLALYSEWFMKIGIVTAVIAVLMVISAPLIHRVMQSNQP
ncbi:oligopeptide:H+ symporter [Jinshanibacter sp. LJY008]|uniref:Oligopeptide:H+ symporter n=1 Tax=Limnobaculum eriocheiris TaxID=2897391 RepID=A0A9X1MXG2_9GAMM|nr:oligopeptide:H+ symporter [Limnobaculum eriocheiris]